MPNLAKRQPRKLRTVRRNKKVVARRTRKSTGGLPDQAGGLKWPSWFRRSPKPTQQSHNTEPSQQPIEPAVSVWSRAVPQEVQALKEGLEGLDKVFPRLFGDNDDECNYNIIPIDKFLNNTSEYTKSEVSPIKLISPVFIEDDNNRSNNLRSLIPQYAYLINGSEIAYVIVTNFRQHTHKLEKKAIKFDEFKTKKIEEPFNKIKWVVIKSHRSIYTSGCPEPYEIVEKPMNNVSHKQTQKRRSLGNRIRSGFSRLFSRSKKATTNNTMQPNPPQPIPTLDNRVNQRIAELKEKHGNSYSEIFKELGINYNSTMGRQGLENLLKETVRTQLTRAESTA